MRGAVPSQSIRACSIRQRRVLFTRVSSAPRAHLLLKVGSWEIVNVKESRLSEITAAGENRIARLGDALFTGLANHRSSDCGLIFGFETR
ncbi:hypothetical protein J1614_006968 [Plenodomus biglobosus]|nr:hypothetical protein J1614_006968 [Plenodomus biglobosus]